MSDISIRQRYSYFGDDGRWIGGGGEDLEVAFGVTFDRSKFDLVSAFPNGFLPSGICLGKITATGLYGPYGGATSEQQTLTRTSTGGTITLAFDGSPVSATIPATAAGFTAAAVQAALEGLSTINPGDVAVTGAAGGPLTVTFGGRYIGQDVPQLVVDNALATGGSIVAATSVAGGSAVSDGRQTAVGFLAWPVRYDRASTSNFDGAVYWRGPVIVSRLPANNGLDAAAQAALNKCIFL